MSWDGIFNKDGEVNVSIDEVSREPNIFVIMEPDFGSRKDNTQVNRYL